MKKLNFEAKSILNEERHSGGLFVKMKPYFGLLLFVLGIAASGALASDQVPAPPQNHPIALIGGDIHTVSGDVISNGTILFDKGRIVGIGAQIALPDGTERIDVSGLHVYPGLIDANTTIGLTEISAVRATRDFAEVGQIKPNVRTEVGWNPDSEILPVTRANGITVAQSVPLGGLISGKSGLMMLDGWTWESMTLKAPDGLHIWWPRMRIIVSPFMRQKPKEQEKARDEAIAKIRKIFAEAKAYLKAKAAEKNPSVPKHESDLRLEAMRPVLEKQIPVYVHADDILQIEAAVDWARETGVRMVLVGGYDAPRVSNLLKNNNIPVIIGGIYRLPMRRWEDYETPFTVPVRLFKAGVKFCIGSSGGPFNAAHERNLPYNAGAAAAYGLPKTEALRAVTLYPAQIMGVEDRIGSLEKGKDATLIVTTGDPLEISTQVKMEFIQGRKVDLSSRHTQLYEKYLKKYRQMHLWNE